MHGVACTGLSIIYLHPWCTLFSIHSLALIFSTWTTTLASPFKGQGANQALLDAFDLAKALLDQCDSKKGHAPPKTKVGDDEGDSIVKALEYFERVMLERSSRKVENSRTAAAVLHTPAACQRANCVRAGAALGENDPQKQTKRSAVDERDAEIVVSTMKARMFGLDVS